MFQPELGCVQPSLGTWLPVMSRSSVLPVVETCEPHQLYLFSRLPLGPFEVTIINHRETVHNTSWLNSMNSEDNTFQQQKMPESGQVRNNLKMPEASIHSCSGTEDSSFSIQILQP